MTESKATPLDKIKNIPINRLIPHPKNPRKNVTDIDSLAKSIGYSGIRQNLIVVPADCEEYIKKTEKQKKAYNGDYYVLAGHRRHAAAKKVGLENVPCAIETDLSMVEQIGLMVEENHQRKALTTGEECIAMQMMLELGDTADGISKKVGISSNTVKKRIKIAKILGAETLISIEKMVDGIIKVDDYEKLCDIVNDNERNILMDKLGTTDFDWHHTMALEKQHQKTPRNQVIRLLGKNAEKIENPEILNSPDVQKIENIYRYDSGDLKSAEEASKLASDDVKIAYTEDESGTINIYAIGKSIADEKEKEAQAIALVQKEYEERVFRLTEAFKQAYEMRVSYVKKLTVTTPEEKKVIESEIVRLMLTNLDKPEDYIIRKVFDIRGQLDESTVSNLINNNRLDIIMLRSVYARIEPGVCSHLSAYGNKLNAVYDFIERLGYITSEEEAQLTEGTHPLQKEEQNGQRPFLLPTSRREIAEQFSGI